MNVKLRSLGTLILALLAPLAGCQQYVVRDKNVYVNEVGFMVAASEQEAEALVKFIAAHCPCDSVTKNFSTEACASAAKLVQVVRSQVPYHRDMMFYNASITSVRPPKNVPAVPNPSTLCP